MCAASVKVNSLANYLGQAYRLGIGIVITPLYLDYLGAEAFGLIGFFALAQSWFAVLDLGFSPTLGREVPVARSREQGFTFFRRLLRSFELIFVSFFLLAAALSYFSRGWISVHWIDATDLSFSTVSECIFLMGLIVALRWFAALYRSGINGFEDQVWLNLATTVLVSLKFFGALLLLAFISQDVTHFFWYQLFIGGVEVILLGKRLYRSLPIVSGTSPGAHFDLEAVKSVAPFAIATAYSTLLWAMITQTDKLILSGVLTLSDFGYLSLVTLVAGAVTTVAMPVSLAILPRMTLLFSQGRKSEFQTLYSVSSQFVTLFTSAVSLTIAFNAETLLYAWTGNRAAASWGADVLPWFVLGNGILAVSAFQYYLQSSIGQLRLHVIGSTISIILQLPVLIIAAFKYEALGVAVAWFGLRSIWFLVWSPVVHSRFLPGFHCQWLVREILPVAATVVAVAVGVSQVAEFSPETSRALLFLELCLEGGVTLLLTVLFVPSLRAVCLRMVAGK